MTKCVHFIPTTITLTAEGTAQLFQDHIWKHHGWPKKVVSDQGVQFTVCFMKELNHLLGIKMGISTAYHPQIDGQSEHVN
jgi:hypothetical protein